MKKNYLQCLENVGIRWDANETAFLDRELQQIEENVYDVVYSILKAQKFVPMTPDLEDWAETWSIKIWDVVGMAKVISNYADDLPRADKFVTEVIFKTLEMGAAYGFNVKELRVAAKLGRSLETERAVTARQAIERRVDDHLAFGTSVKNITGFLNNPNVGSDSVTNGDWLNPATTVDEILNDLYEMERTVYLESGENYEPTDIVLPNEHFGVISTRKAGVDSRDTILQVFLANSRFVKNVDEWGALRQAASGNHAMAVCYRKDPMFVKCKYNNLFEQHPPQPRNLEWVVNCTALLAGCEFPRPLGAHYFTGIGDPS